MPDPEAHASDADLLADLTPAQRRAVETSSAPLCVLAAAGAGKTRVLTRRIAYRVATGSAEASHVLALTFTRKAAGELAGRLLALGLRERVTAGTFHAIAAAQLRQWWRDTRRPARALLDRKAPLLAPLAAERRGLAGVSIAELAGHIEWAKARLITPEDFEAASAGRQLSADAGEVAALYQRYQLKLTEKRLVDFDDLLRLCADAVERDPAFAAAQRWRFRHVFVDEFQDLNPLQDRVLRAWLGTGTDLCVVGDPHQAIYGWNGADAGLLASFAERWPGSEVVRLDDNHRCTPQVVAAGAAVLGPAGERLRSTRPDGPLPSVRAYSSETAEAHGVAGEIRAAHHSGVPWRQMAVLVRTNAQMAVLRQALRAAKVPHRVPGGAALLDHPAVRDALEDLRRRGQLPFSLLLADLDASARDARQPGGAGREDADRGGDGQSGTADAVVALCELAQEFARLDPAATAAAFVSWLPAALGDDSTADGDAVTVSSFHRAKGLEWSAVWLCGLEQGLVPFGRSPGAASQSEERRLLYVALTRAEYDLHCSWAQTRSFGGHPVRRQPSPWLSLIEAAGRDSTMLDETSAEGWRERLAEQRAVLAATPGSRRRGQDDTVAPGGRLHGASGRNRQAAARSGPGADPVLLATLRAWRAQRARAAGIPAHVLLHDRTLEAIASRRPGSEAELLAVPGIGPVKAARFGEQLLALVGSARASA